MIGYSFTCVDLFDARLLRGQQMNFDCLRLQVAGTDGMYWPLHPTPSEETLPR